MSKWIKNKDDILVPSRQAGFIQPGIGLMNKKQVVGTASYWDPTKNAMTLSNTNKTVESSATKWNSVMGVTSRSSGKRYFEVHVDALAAPSYFLIGVATSNFAPKVSGNYIGQDNYSWGYEDNGRYYHNAVMLGTTSTYTSGSSVGVAVDITIGNLWFSVNGVWVSGNPATGSSPLMTGLGSLPIYAAVSLYNSSNKGTLRVENNEFLTAPPAGFTSWSGL